MRLRSLVITLALVAAGAAALVVAGPTAGAHEGESVIVVESSTPTAAGVDLAVRVTWENDGHPAVDSTVTAVPLRADGTALPPQTMTPVDTDGRYQVSLVLPDAGPWRVRVATISPTGTLEADLPAPAPVPAPTVTAAETSTTQTAAPTTAKPTTTAASDRDATEDGSEDDDAGVPWLAIVIVIPIVIVAAAAAIAIRSGRQSD